jgi:carbonic anhydrase
MKEKQSDNSLVNKILTAEEQLKLTPDEVLNVLKQGNREFAENSLTIRNNTERIRKHASSQFPKAVVVSCMDSRVPVEDIFHRGIGDMFVVRIAGNFINEDILGSLEIACKISSAKLIVILGHERCEAIRSAIDDVRLGSITTTLSKIRPAVETVKVSFSGEKTSSNLEYSNAVCIQNIKNAIHVIRTQSPILKDMEDNGDIKIAGGIYNMETGKVSFL